MLAITAEFMHGTFRAHPEWSGRTGRDDLGEWPPSVTRLLAAFVAADGMGADCRVTDGAELEFLEGLGPPTILAEANPHRQRLEDRFVSLAFQSVRRFGQAYPIRAWDPIGDQDRQPGGGHPPADGGRPPAAGGHPPADGEDLAPAAGGARTGSGVRISLRHPTVAFVWPDADPAPWLGALRMRAARIGYLGCADSPVRMRVEESLDEHRLGPLHQYRPRVDGSCLVAVPRPGKHLLGLSATYESWRHNGAPPQLPAVRNLVAYEGPDDLTDEFAAGVVAAWLRLKPGVPGGRLAAVTAALKAAVMSRYERLYGDPLPQALHGHGFEGKGFEIARYLALPDVGFERSDGQIRGAAVWLPPGCDADTRERVRSAARSIDVLKAPGLDVGVTPWRGSGSTAARPDRWQQPSVTWVTAVPAIHERFGRLDLAEVGRWCRNAGLPEPVAFRSGRAPLVAGALNLRPEEVERTARRRAGTTKPYSHIELRFAAPVRGPVVIGRGRSRGFGLCVPVHPQ